MGVLSALQTCLLPFFPCVVVQHLDRLGRCAHVFVLLMVQALGVRAAVKRIEILLDALRAPVHVALACLNPLLRALRWACRSVATRLLHNGLAAGLDATTTPLAARAEAAEAL